MRWLTGHDGLVCDTAMSMSMPIRDLKLTRMQLNCARTQTGEPGCSLLRRIFFGNPRTHVGLVLFMMGKSYDNPAEIRTQVPPVLEI